MVREAWTDERLDDFRSRVDERFDEVDRRFDAVDRRLDRIDEKFERLYKLMFQASVAVVVALLGILATQL